MDIATPLYARGPYRVLAASALDEDDDSPARAFVVTDTAGARLREEPSFDAARAWVDGRIDSAVVMSVAPRARRR